MSNQQHSEWFLSLMEEHKGIIYKIARSFQKDSDDQKDLVQEIILQLWRSLPAFDHRAKVSTWLYKVALNVAISSYRRDKKKGGVMVPFSESVLDVPADETQNDPRLQLLQQFINELPELDRALMLLYLEEKSGKEMAEILGLSEANVRTKTNRIKDKLKQRFSSINE